MCISILLYLSHESEILIPYKSSVERNTSKTWSKKLVCKIQYF